MQKVLFSCLIFTLFTTASNGQQYQLASPDGHLSIQINNDKSLHFSLMKDGKPLLLCSVKFFWSRNYRSHRSFLPVDLPGGFHCIQL